MNNQEKLSKECCHHTLNPYCSNCWDKCFCQALCDAVVIDKPIKNDCPDCKDGFYYPLIGEPEPCQTCKGEVCPEPPDSCSNCNDTNYHLGHPQGTPGPCPDCNGDPPADIASYEGDSSQDASFDRQCKTAFNDIVNKDHPCIYYSAEKFRPIVIEFYSQHSRERRIALLISNIKHFCNEEVLRVEWFDVNIQESKFFETWDMDRTAWKTGVYLKMIPNYGDQHELP